MSQFVRRAGETVITPARFPEVRKFAAAAAKERASIKPGGGTSWWRVISLPGSVEEPTPEPWGEVGVCGMLFRGSIARIKGVFIIPHARGRGHGARAVDQLEQAARERGCSAIECFAWNAPFYEARGYHVCGRNSHGATRLIRSV